MNVEDEEGNSKWEAGESGKGTKEEKGRKRGDEHLNAVPSLKTPASTPFPVVGSHPAALPSQASTPRSSRGP